MSNQANGISEQTKKIMEDWLRFAEATTGFSQERITEILREKFGAFGISKRGDMMAHLMTVKDKEFVKEYMTRRAEELKTPECPICGELTIGDAKWNGRFTKTPGWRCTKGGLQHFMMAKANHIAKMQNKPVPFQEVSVEPETTIDATQSE